MQQDAEKARDADRPDEAGTKPGAEAEITAEAAATQATAEAEIAELKDRLLRALADMENLRRRHGRELDEARKYAMTGFARDLLDVADNMRRAIEAVPEEARRPDEPVSNLLAGVELTERALLGAFEKHGVRRVVPERGEKFDHNRHQAMFEVPTADPPPGHVAEIMQTGWAIADRLLRPALVGVAKALPEPAAGPSDPRQGAADSRV